MSFTIGTERSTAMVCVTEPMPEDDFSWASCGGDAISHRKVVQPHDNKVKKLDDQLSR
jgi:hypothetical protein